MGHIYKTIYEITTDEEYAGAGAFDPDTSTDLYVRYHYSSWEEVKASNGELIQELADNFRMFPGGVKADQDEEGRWYLEFTQGNIDCYFRNMYSRFVEAVAALDQVPESGMKDWCPALDNVNEIYSDDSGNMILEAENGWMTPQEFMRFVEPGTRYYLCGALDVY